MNRRPLLATAVTASALLASCGGRVDARDQWTVSIATDLPVPQLADRALVEVLRDDGSLACPECRRQLGLPTDPEAWPISFGIAATTPSARVRVRLYDSARVDAAGLPAPGFTLDRTVALPPARGDTRVTMVLLGECLGLPSDVGARTSCVGPERTVVPERVLSASIAETARPGTWPRAKRDACTDAAPAGMVCVPGGFFTLGTRPGQALEDGIERFARVSRFFLDVAEVDVGTVRRLVAAGALASEPDTGSKEPGAPEGASCTYLGALDARNDALPLNCVDAAQADAICAALGKRLPTEAEWEWAAGNLERESLYPWGSAGDPCLLADVGLGGTSFETSAVEFATCRVLPGRRVRPRGLPATPNPADATTLGLRAMAGGLSEWVADDQAPLDTPCWRPEEPFLDDPRCMVGEQARRAVRGRSWTNDPGQVSSQVRSGEPAAARLAYVGLRCARDGAPR